MNHFRKKSLIIIIYCVPWDVRKKKKFERRVNNTIENFIVVFVMIITSSVVHIIRCIFFMFLLFTTSSWSENLWKNWLITQKNNINGFHVVTFSKGIKTKKKRITVDKKTIEGGWEGTFFLLSLRWLFSESLSLLELIQRNLLIKKQKKNNLETEVRKH